MNNGLRERADGFGRIARVIVGATLLALNLSAGAQDVMRPAGPLGPYVYETKYDNQRFGYEFGIGSSGVPESNYVALDAPANKSQQFPLMGEGQYFIAGPYLGFDIHNRAFGTSVFAELKLTPQPVTRTVNNTVTNVRELRVIKLILQTDGLWWHVVLDPRTGAVDLFRSTPLPYPSGAQASYGINFEVKRIYPATLNTLASTWMSENLENDPHRNFFTNGVIQSPANERAFYRDSFRKLAPPDIDRNFPGAFRVARLIHYPDRNAGRGEFEIVNLLFGHSALIIRSVEIGPNDFSLAISARYSLGIPHLILEGVQQPFSSRYIQHFGVLGKHFQRVLTQTTGRGFQLSPFARAPLPARAISDDRWFPSSQPSARPIDQPFILTN